MNAVEIEEAISELADQPFDPAEFPFSFLRAFGMKDATLKRLRATGKASTNASDVGGVLQRNKIHIATAEPGQAGSTLARLRESPSTTRAKAQFILATDGETIEAEEIGSGEVLSLPYAKLADGFAFFLALAGISTVKAIKNNPIDIKATARLNKLYVELLRENEDWGTPEKRQQLNQFMARLIFCFFAEDTGIFRGDNLFTETVRQMSESRPKASSEGKHGNTHEVIRELFRAMDIDTRDGGAARKAAEPRLANWADAFPYVNGGLFTADVECPRFSRIARTYLLRAGELDWTEINPDIFGSMIQAVADDDERGELGMHYTSVPNIRKVLDPLFLDSLREQLERAGDNARKLLNLRKRLASIRVFDPACGSGNFLVIAYREMREIEAEIVRRRDDPRERSWIRLTQFHGIEIKSFAAEIARLALLIAEFQSDVRFIGQSEARSMVLPLHRTGRIVTGNALRIDWLEVCPPVKGTRATARDLFEPEQEEVDFDDIEVETYLCGNPPYKGTKAQSASQKADLSFVFPASHRGVGSLDFISGWFWKGSRYLLETNSSLAFVSTNSICQGVQVPSLWSDIIFDGVRIHFAYSSFKWSNLASNNAGVTVVIVGLANGSRSATLFSNSDSVESSRIVPNIGPYLIAGDDVIVTRRSKRAEPLSQMVLGNQPYEGGNLILEFDGPQRIELDPEEQSAFIRDLYGSSEIIGGVPRQCIWVENDRVEQAIQIPFIEKRVTAVQKWRQDSKRPGTRAMARTPHRFCEMKRGDKSVIAVPIRSSETRDYLTVDRYDATATISNLAYAIYMELFSISASFLATYIGYGSKLCAANWKPD